VLTFQPLFPELRLLSGALPAQNLELLLLLLQVTAGLVQELPGVGGAAGGDAAGSRLRLGTPTSCCALLRGCRAPRRRLARLDDTAQGRYLLLPPPLWRC
jgi:hypothetical protein